MEELEGEAFMDKVWACVGENEEGEEDQQR